MTQTHRSASVSPTFDDTFLAGPGEAGLVSVVIPTYNRAHLIGRAIESVLDQTYQPVEVIVVDDGSSDNTREVVERYDPRVRYIRQANAGAATARNTGLRVARGEFLALLDSDDEWFPWKLEAQVRVLDRYPEIGMVWTDMTATDEAGVVLHDRYLRMFYNAHALARIEDVCECDDSLSDAWPRAPRLLGTSRIVRGDIFSRILLGNLVHTSTLLARRTRLHEAGEIDVEFTPLGEDYEFHVRICSHGPVALIDAPSMLYRIGAADQLTAPHLGVYTARSNLKTVLRWLDRGGGRIRLPHRAVRDRLAQAYRWVGESEMHFGEWDNARVHLWQSLQHRPGQMKAVMLLMFSMMPAPIFRAALAAKKRMRALRNPRVAALIGHVALLGWMDPIVGFVGDLALNVTTSTAGMLA
jgi:glycosyltransferase involved in cell wall biosynthesis